jgi:hypothetical protein
MSSTKSDKLNISGWSDLKALTASKNGKFVSISSGEEGDTTSGTVTITGATVAWKNKSKGDTYVYVADNLLRIAGKEDAVRKFLQEALPKVYPGKSLNANDILNDSTKTITYKNHLTTGKDLYENEIKKYNELQAKKNNRDRSESEGLTLKEVTPELLKSFEATVAATKKEGPTKSSKGTQKKTDTKTKNGSKLYKRWEEIKQKGKYLDITNLNFDTYMGATTQSESRKNGGTIESLKITAKSKDNITPFLKFLSELSKEDYEKYDNEFKMGERKKKEKEKEKEAPTKSILTPPKNKAVKE